MTRNATRLAAAAVLAACVGCSGGVAASSGDSGVIVTYEVTGDATHARVSADTPSGEQETLADSTFTPPMKPSWSDKPGLRYRFQHGDSVQLLASVTGPQGTYVGARGSVTCRIKVGTAVLDEQTASADDAQGGIATCRATVP